MNIDGNIERDRYDRRAQALLIDPQESFAESILSIPQVLRSPYCYYYECIKNQLSSEMKVLEIGAGTGAHTGVSLQSGAQVIASDISAYSLEVLANRYSSYANLSTQVADMESLPFHDNTFDLVISAGSLSYGDNQLVMQEIYRVLRLGGKFVVVDSLNHNWIYRFNRWLHYKKCERSLSTLKRMPTLNLIQKYENAFLSCEVRFFGAISWLMPVVSFLIGQDKAARLSDRFDSIFRVKKSAFKFVMIAKKAANEVG